LDLGFKKFSKLETSEAVETLDLIVAADIVSDKKGPFGVAVV
jgi:hypothetical protein